MIKWAGRLLRGKTHLNYLGGGAVFWGRVFLQKKGKEVSRGEVALPQTDFEGKT